MSLLANVVTRLKGMPLRARLPEQRHAVQTVALLAAAMVALAAAVTVAISVFSGLRFASYSPAGSVALETAAGLTSALAAYLAFGRFRLTGSLADFALIAALGLLAVTTLLFFTGPSLTGAVSRDFSVWGRALGQLLAAAAFFAAAFVSADPIAEHRGRILALLGTYAVLAVGGLVTLLVFGPQLELPDELPSESLARPLVVGPPTLLVLHLATALILLAATVGFVRSAAERRDALTFALALGCPLAAGAAVHNFLFPSPYASYVFAADVFRLSFYALVLAGALRQIAVYQRTAELQGMSRERERVARDLHDGPVQDLALAQVLLSQVAARTSDPALQQVDAATGRALREWRLAVSNLQALDERALAQILEEVARGAVRRSGIELELDVDPSVDAPPPVRRHLVYVLREALSNVVRHSRARRVRVQVDAVGGVTLVVADDGGGFDAEPEVVGDGSGLRSMRERARALGADCRVASGPSGTRVTFAVPASVLRREGAP